VLEEREKARQVVLGLQRRYAGRFKLVPVLWEELPLQADQVTNIDNFRRANDRRSP